MDGSIYLIALVFCGLVVASCTTFAQRRWGRRGLLGAAFLVASLLLALGYSDYRAQTVKDTPLNAYLLGSVGSTALAALVVALCARLGLRISLQVALGCLAWLGATWLIVVWLVFV